MRPKLILILTTAMLSTALGAGGIATAQDRYGNDNLRNKQPIQQQDRNRQTKGQAPSSAQSPAATQPQTQTTPDQTQTAPANSASQPQQNSRQSNSTTNATGSSPSGTTESGANQPAAGQSDQPSSAQTAPPASANQPSAAQTAPSDQTQQPSTAAGGQAGQQQPSTAQRQPAQGGVNANVNAQTQSGTRLSASLQTAQRTRLTQAVAQVNVRPVTNVNFSLSVGTAVPRTVTLHPVPLAMVRIIPQYRGYSFFVVRNEIVIVEPRTLKIVDVIERSGTGSRAQAPAATRSKLNLSSQQKEIIRKRSTRRVTTTTGSAPPTQTTIIVGEEAPSTVEIHSFPEEVYREVPAIRSYRYIKDDRGIYLVEPQGRRVIEELD